MKQKIKRFSSILFLIAFVFCASTYGTATAESPQPSNEERYDLALNTWLDNLANCESGSKNYPKGNPNAVNKVDSDGKPAYGLMQYKLGTFMAFAKKYKVYPEISIDTVHKYAMDGDKSFHLTKIVISTDPKMASHWGCTKKVGKPPVKSDFI